MLSIATGHDVGYLTGPVAGGRESYYTGAVAAGEPAGVWFGAGADALGLHGQVDADLMEAVYTHLLDPRHPATLSRSTWGEAPALAAKHRTYRSPDEIYADLLEAHPHAGPERRAALRSQAERSARQAVAFLDATFSAPKSVTVLAVAFERAANEARAAGDERAAQAWAAHQRAVEEAVLAGARAGLEYLQDAAGYSRVGHHGGGAGRWVDAHRFVVAQFLQHDSRNRDPQLHVHNAILNRVECADGVWRTLDSRAIHAHRGAAGAIAERVMEAHLARSLGVEIATRPDGRAREVVGIASEVLDLFSSRRRAIGARAEELMRAFRDRFGREPSPLERTRIAQQATLATRAAKSHSGETLEQRLDRWEAEARVAVAGGLAQVARDVLDRRQRAEPAAGWSERDVVERALAGLGDARQSWSRSDLTRALSDALPGNLEVPPERVRELLDGLTEAALPHAVRLTAEEPTVDLPDALRRSGGESVYAQPGAARYATPGQLVAERILQEAAVRRGAATLSDEEITAALDRFTEAGRPLGQDQAAAVRGVLGSGAQIEVLSAAAGTGKSFTIAAIADAWTASRRRVIGLAPSQAAAQVLAEEGVRSVNIARWLGARDGSWQAGPDDLVVVDEAGMASIQDLLEIQRRCSAAGAKLLLVGDPRQLSAVGPGGALADIAAHGVRYELAEVRRFRSGWERHASLRLREGDVDVVDEYLKRGRIVDGGTPERTETAAVRAWLADTLAGRESLLLVGSNEAAARVSAQLRAELVALGRVAEPGVPTRDGTVAGVGDLVQARRNGWELIGVEGNTRAPINRETYRVTDVHEDGALTVTCTRGDVSDERMVLPARYVAEHVTLGYASTVHAAQGRTVDTTHAVLGSGSDAASAYVAMTRGRLRNTAWAITRAAAPDAPPGETQSVEPRTGRAVLADILSRRPARSDDVSATAFAEQDAEAARSARRSIDRLALEITEATAGRLGADLDRLTAAGVLREQDSVALAADPAYGGLQRLLRSAELAGHDRVEVLRESLAGRSLNGARSVAQILHSRITSALQGRLLPDITSYRDLIPEGISEERRGRLEALADAAEERRRDLGARAAAEPPQWAQEALGPVPDDLLERAEWEHRAGWAAAYREIADHTDDADPLGAPPAGLAEKYAAWRAAHRALDLPDAGADERELSDGQLRVRVRAYERELNWAPRWVGHELAAVHLAADRARIDAENWTARAATTTDPATACDLSAAAEKARAEAADIAERAVQLEIVDEARARWFAHTAVTRDLADRARAELGARGVDLDDARDRVTAWEWLEAHRAVQPDADEHLVISQADLTDGERDSVHGDERPVVESSPLDLRELTMPDAAEHRDTQRHRQAPTDETMAAVAQAQAVLAEIAAREQHEAALDDAEMPEEARRQQLLRWGEHDQAEAAPASEDATACRG